MKKRLKRILAGLIVVFALAILISIFYNLSNENKRGRGEVSLSPGSCAGNCGFMSEGCFCDALCVDYGDCCDDFTEWCCATDADCPNNKVYLDSELRLRDTCYNYYCILTTNNPGLPPDTPLSSCGIPGSVFCRSLRSLRSRR